MIRKTDSFKVLADKLAEKKPPPKHTNRGQLDENLINMVRRNSYLYQSKSQRKGDGLKTVPYSDMGNKQLLFKIIDDMEGGTNLLELESLLQVELDKYKENFREEMTKYHQEINEKIKAEMDTKRDTFYEKPLETERKSSLRMHNIRRLSFKRAMSQSRN